VINTQEQCGKHLQNYKNGNFLKRISTAEAPKLKRAATDPNEGDAAGLAAALIVGEL
jgi:hypothetical protein